MSERKAIQLAVGYDIREDVPPRPLPFMAHQCQACGCDILTPTSEPSIPVFCVLCDATDDKWVRRRQRYERMKGKP